MVEKLSMESKNILSENIENIASIFPNALVETSDGKKIDFDILRQELSGDIVDGSKERYHLDFPGKREAIVEANRKINKTLRPIKEKSVDFDNTKNIYIEGDNLEALKILQESYLGKIKCIYIDPPYNTGNNLIYKNDFSISEIEELTKEGKIDDDNNKLVVNLKSSGRFHSDWIKMMFSRLKIARNLLLDDGCIVVSIDDSELMNLKEILDEIFGESNYIGVVTVVHKPEGRNQARYFATSNEFALFYAKNIDIFDFESVVLSEEKNNEYNLKDENGYYKLNSLIAKNHGREGYDKNLKKNSPERAYPIYVSKDLQRITLTETENYIQILPNTSSQERTWRYIISSMKDKIANNEVVAIFENSEIKLYEKYRIENGELIKTHWTDKKYNAMTNGTKVLDDLMKVKTFDFPKSVFLMQDIFKICATKNSTVIDFFSGSATTAHAVMKLNAEDGGNRKFILVQLPEAIDESSEAYKAGYKTICDIGEERIRRAGKKIKEENPMLTQNLDIGFRVYKVDSSNMKDIYYTPDKIDQVHILDMVSNVKEDRTAEDLLTQVILNLGLPLDLHIDEKMVGKNKLFFVEENALVACFDETIDLSILDEIEKVKPLKICLRESSFTKDQDKINFFEKLKKLSPDTEATII